MTKKHRLLILFVSILSLFSFSLVPVMVRADDSISEADKHAAEQAQEQAKILDEQRHAADQQRQEDLKKAAEQQQEAAKKQSEAEKEQTKKENEAFQKNCEDKREHFKTRMEDINEHTQKQLETLDTIDQRIEAFVEDNNLSFPAFMADLTAIKTQSRLAHTITETTKKSAEGFDCGTDRGNAQASLLSFKDATLQQADIVEAYKADVKKLISDIKASVQPSSESQGAQQ